MDEGEGSEDEKGNEKQLTSEEVYEEILLNCFRYLDFDSLQDAETLTLREYKIRMKAYRLKRIDREYDMHLQAWLNHQVTATKESGKKQVPVFKKFKNFYDYEARVNEVKKPTEVKLTQQMKRLANLAVGANGKGGEDG
ncbi:hypothetical protein P4637_03190 [Halalkalibacterium halodurans]|uniref:hypothetical protein n=1 Tax=Halalkalibacterium halodurans TaxID=86665 RepID=UPI002E1D1C72|nr:hypothetical protein [Halalkalibacterium halodurans]MED4105505.1 hypothetical protein [Halalkalibacterium halodurans]MED4109289.1 hypothetical protein [Halalkalibacterium halodurans]MED4149697.1 hypothetical protein [Halalkalibacterium halodurans]